MFKQMIKSPIVFCQEKYIDLSFLNEYDNDDNDNRTLMTTMNRTKTRILMTTINDLCLYAHVAFTDG